MPSCTGCSKVFKRLEGSRCEACQHRPPTDKPRHEWPTCGECGKLYEFLALTSCVTCQLDSINMPPPSLPAPPATGPLVPQDYNRSIEYSMSNPANPRTHGDVPYINPFQTGSNGRLDENGRAEFGKKAIDAFQNGYSNAIQKVNPHVQIARSKLRGDASMAARKPERQISIVIRKIVNTNKSSIKTQFHPVAQHIPVSAPWSSFLKTTTTFLDGIYSDAHRFRIQSSDQFVLYYLTSDTKLTPELAGMQADEVTVQMVWDASIEQVGVNISKGNIAKSLLELVAHVDYPPKDDQDDCDLDGSETRVTRASSRTSQKRRAESTLFSASNNRPSKRLSAGNSADRGYYSNITAILPPWPAQVPITVYKLTFSRDESGKAQWAQSDTTFQVILSKEYFDSGKTKKAFKLLFDNSRTQYAAKEFFDLGTGHEVTESDNLKYLKEELSRQDVMKTVVNSFKRASDDKSVAIFDITVADAFILTAEDGSSWLVDVLLDPKKMRKFSGTDQAGRNTDFAGETCDALAHFALIDTEFDFVPVNIQGISRSVMRNRVQVNSVILFDLMGHSRNSTLGLGDQGAQGILNFIEQHACNSICTQLELSPLNEFEVEIGELQDIVSQANLDDQDFEDAPSIPVRNEEQSTNESQGN